MTRQPALHILQHRPDSATWITGAQFEIPDLGDTSTFVIDIEWARPLGAPPLLAGVRIDDDDVHRFVPEIGESAELSLERIVLTRRATSARQLDISAFDRSSRLTLGSVILFGVDDA